MARRDHLEWMRQTTLGRYSPREVAAVYRMASMPSKQAWRMKRPHAERNPPVITFDPAPTFWEQTGNRMKLVILNTLPVSHDTLGLSHAAYPFYRDTYVESHSTPTSVSSALCDASGIAGEIGEGETDEQPAANWASNFRFDTRFEARSRV